MLYPKQANNLFLILLLQLSICCKNSCKNRSSDELIPIQKASHKGLSLGNTAKKDCAYHPNKNTSFNHEPDFDPYYGYGDQSDTNTDSGAGYDTGYDTDTDTKPNKIPKPSSACDATKKDTSFNFEDQILSIRKIADWKRGIIANVSGNSFRREVDNSNTNGNLFAAEDYIIIVLNIYRAAIKICGLYKKDSLFFETKVNEFYKWFNRLTDQSADFWMQKVKQINRAVVLQLQANVFQNESINQVNENLRLAENYVGLADTHYDVTTIFTIQNHKFALEDQQVFQLTDKQRDEYINREAKDWYINLSSFEKMLVDSYVNKFLDSKHYIPTQLRQIPGLRNAYQKNIWEYDKNGQKKRLAMYYHSGSMASPNKPKDEKTRKANLQITKDNWKQVQEKNKNVEIVSLNYNKDLLGFENLKEKKIVEDTTTVVGVDRFMNLSINPIGTSSNIYKKYTDLVGYIVNFYQKDYPDLCKSFTDELQDKSFVRKSINFLTNQLKKSRDQWIEKIKDPKDKHFFKRLVALEEYAKMSGIWRDIKQSKALISGNPNATTGAVYIAFIAFMGSLNNDETIPAVLFSCKSGKDRTGLMSLLVDACIILMHCPTLTQDEVINVLIRIGHYQLLASINGGMPGRGGLKEVKADQVAKKYCQQLFPKTATLTKIN